MKRLLLIIGALLFSIPAFAQAPTKICFPTNGPNCQDVTSINPFPVTGTISVTFPTIGAAVPATGIYNGINVAGTLRGVTGLSLGSTFSQTVAVVDASGNQITSFGVSTVLTPITPAATTATQGLLLGGQYNSTQATFTNGQQGSLQISSRGELKTNIMDAAGNARGLNVDASGQIAVTIAAAQSIAVTQSTSPWIIAGGGTAGTAATGVITIQGIASMTKLLVTPDANSAVNVAQINGITPLMGNGVTGTGSPRITLASDGTAISTTGYMSVKIDQTTPGTTNAVSIAQIGGTTIVNGGVAGSQSVGGTVATNVAITANPLNLGAQGVSSENSAVTTARQVQLVADLVGKLIVLPYANPENFVSGTTSAMTGTTSTSLVASPGGSLRNYITQIACVNSHATVGTFITIQDGSGGTALATVAAAAVYGGETVTFPTPLRQPTTATAIFVANVTTGANVICSATGYKGL